ncbi:MAG: ethanolamine ammonia-lyase reactivating factor EutA, partial [Oscillospiraceae bacterium]
MMGTELLSVGIDIGTSTTSMVVSRLALENTASCFTVPRVAITGSEILYRGTIYETPQQEGNRIDADKIAALLRREYKAAG